MTRAHVKKVYPSQESTKGCRLRPPASKKAYMQVKRNMWPSSSFLQARSVHAGKTEYVARLKHPASKEKQEGVHACR